jgi:hypothetical protein
MAGEIISEWWATSNRSGGRDHSGIVGDIERNQQPVFPRKQTSLLHHRSLSIAASAARPRSVST